MKIKVLSGEDFKSNLKLHNDIIKLATPSYEDPSIILASAIVNYDTAYLAYDEDDNLLSFFTTGIEELLIAEQKIPTIHLGWTCSTQESKGSGAAQTVYRKFIENTLKLQQSNGIKFLLWGTTATPIGFYLYQKNFADVRPDWDGNYSQSSIEIANALRIRLGATEKDNHPFVLKRCNKGRFSKQEVERIEAINRVRGFTLFENLGLDERQGDRLLVLCHLPNS